VRTHERVHGSVLVDIFRRYPPATVWIKTQIDLAVPVPACIEFWEGAKNKEMYREAQKILSRLAVAYLTLDDQDWALERLSLYHLSHGVGGLDCLIAAPAARLGLPLYTLNLRHFAPLLGAGAHQLYGDVTS